MTVPAVLSSSSKVLEREKLTAASQCSGKNQSDQKYFKRGTQNRYNTPWTDVTATILRDFLSC